jgi:hypothetical protein
VLLLYRLTATFTAIIYLGFFFISFGISDETGSGARYGVSLFFPAAMSMGAVVFSNLEGAGGVDINSARTDYQGYTVAACLGFMVLDMFIYFLIGLYFGQVATNDTGIS